MRRRMMTVLVAAFAALCLAGCATMEYESGPERGEMHPGHTGHERH